MLPFFSDELELPSVKYLCEAYYSGPLLSAFNSYHSQHDNSCKTNFIKSVTRNFSFSSFCVDFCDSWKGHEKVEQCLGANCFFFTAAVWGVADVVVAWRLEKLEISNLNNFKVQNCQKLQLRKFRIEVVNFLTDSQRG